MVQLSPPVFLTQNSISTQASGVCKPMLYTFLYSAFTLREYGEIYPSFIQLFI